MGISVEDLDSLRAEVDNFLPDTATIIRTDAVIPCRVDDGGQDMRFPEFSRSVRVREWYLRFPDGEDVRAGDLITVTGRGQYTVMEVLNPTSYSTATDAKALMLFGNTDGSALPVQSNATVTLTSKKTGQSVVVYAVLTETNPNGSLGQYAAEFPWTLMIPNTTRYPDHSRPQGGDTVTYERRPGVPKEGTLSKSHPPKTLYLPLYLFMFTEPD
jgi:hypothetical protein